MLQLESDYFERILDSSAIFKMLRVDMTELETPYIIYPPLLYLISPLIAM